MRKSENLSLLNDRKSVCLFPINFDVLLKNRCAKSWKGTTLYVLCNNYLAAYDELLALDDKLNIHRRHYLQFLVIEIYKSKNKLNPSFMWKTIKEKNIPYSRKPSEIGNKLIIFQRKCFAEQPSNKVKRM